MGQNNIADFTLTQYRHLIQLAKAKYSFIFFNEITDDKNLCLWRHDVDFSVENAVKLSQIEKNENVHSTYFIQLSSNFYNVFDPSILKLIKEIISNGHRIALHFYHKAYEINDQKDLETHLSFEKEILEKLTNQKVVAFSFHNPDESIKKFTKLSYSGLVNVYSNEIFNNFSYCSDSNGYWRFQNLDTFLKEGKERIQVLTHPIWWQEDGDLPRNKIKNCLKEKNKQTLKWYDSILSKYGRKNIGMK